MTPMIIPSSFVSITMVSVRR